MTWACRLVDIKELQKNGKNPKPGDIWFAPWMDEHTNLSPEYKRDWKGKRPPLFVQLPNDRVWGVDFISSDKERNWTVKGLPPKISVHPSVNFPGINGYHGLLIGGFLSNDMEGRTYRK